MESPFDRLGPGQVGRWAYQVLGKDGPIFNPSNIRYLPSNYAEAALQGAEPSPLSGINPATLATGLSGVNLLVSTGTLALSAATYAECKKILQVVNQISIDVKEMKSMLQDIQDRVKRIDIHVAENNLREAMRHAFKEAFNPDAIDLASLHCLIGDFQGFAETLDAPLLFNFSFRLSSDVRKEIFALLTFISNLRVLLSHQHNIKEGGNPLTSVRYNLVDDYFDLPMDELVALAFHFGGCDRTFLDFAERLKKFILSNFLFSTESEATSIIEQTHEICFRPIWDDRITNYATIGSEALVNAAAPLKIDYSNAENQAILREVAFSWFYNSDASLIRRTWKELLALRDGYHQVFYPFLSDSDATSSELRKYLFECEMDGGLSQEDASPA